MRFVKEIHMYKTNQNEKAIFTGVVMYTQNVDRGTSDIMGTSIEGLEGCG